jgi:HAD superfamily hydrolase (TIGR01484 family)
MAIELIVTDLDGTLWDAEERIHDRTVAALRELEERPLPLLAATGRRLRSAERTLARHGLRPPTVVLDGAIGADLGSGRRFFEASFARDDALAILGAFTDAGLSPAVYVDDPEIDIVVDERPSTASEHLEHVRPWLARGDLEETVTTRSIYSFVVANGDPAALRQVAAGLNGAGAATLLDAKFFAGWTITVRPSHTSKWEGVRAYCAEHGLDPERVLAVGDGENDVELLAGAAVSCVVADGCDAALDLADHVIDPPCDVGWSSILDLC